MSFNNDNQFSKHKDILLKPYFGKISHEGRFVLTGSEFLQKTHGIDVIIQTKDDKSDIKIDTKHVRGNYTRLFIEELSCSNKGRENLGWLLKDNGHPDYIMHVMNPLCKGCKKICSPCSNGHSEEELQKSMVMYITNYKVLRDWYLPKYENNLLNNFQLIIQPYGNKTTGRNIPYYTLRDELGTIKRDMAEVLL